MMSPVITTEPLCSPKGDFDRWPVAGRHSATGLPFLVTRIGFAGAGNLVRQGQAVGFELGG